MNTFGKNLKHLMGDKHITSYELSILSKIPKGYISELVNEKKVNPSLDVICRLCRGLKISPNELIPKGMWGNDGVIYNKGSIKKVKD